MVPNDSQSQTVTEPDMLVNNSKLKTNQKTEQRRQEYISSLIKQPVSGKTQVFAKKIKIVQDGDSELKATESRLNSLNKIEAIIPSSIDSSITPDATTS